MASYELLKRPVAAAPKLSSAANQPVPASLPRLARRGGQPLPVPVRARMEEAFGVDFNRVRLHTDTEAARVVRAHAAHAVTEGENIAFADGQLAPGTDLGEPRLAHELAHVVQQRHGGAAPSVPRRLARAGRRFRARQPPSAGGPPFSGGDQRRRRASWRPRT